MREIKAKRRNWLAAALVIFAALLSASCGGGAIQGKTASASVAGLVFNTENIDFGAVAVGSSKKASFTVTNSAASTGGSITVSSMIVTGTGFSIVAPTSAFSLAPGQTSTITLGFAPKSAGTSAGNLAIMVTGIADAGNIALTGATAATGSQLTVSPSSLSFGAVAVGTTKNLTGTLTAGASAVTVNSASWNGEGYSLSGISFPLTLAAGKKATYTVTFAPESAGSSSGGVIFLSTAANSSLTETFSGSGGAVAPSSQHSVSLSWSLSNSQVAGYNIYRGTQSGGPYSRLNNAVQAGASYMDSAVQSGATYYYVATSVDIDSTESAFSDEVVATIPTP